MNQKLFFSVLILVIGMSFFSRAFAQTLGSELSDKELDDRLSWIQNELSADRNPSRWWLYSWTGAFCLLAATQTTILFATSDTHLKQNMGVGAVESLFGIVGMLLTPFESTTAADSLHALPDISREEREDKLSTAERLLQKSAKDEAFGRSWLKHVAGFAFNIAGGLVIWKGFHHSLLDGLLNFGIGMAVTELQIFTQPTRSMHAFDDYRKQYAVSASIRFVPKPVGFAVAISF
jgi:hypothetical protein